MNLLLGQDKNIHIGLKWIGNLEENCFCYISFIISYFLYCFLYFMTDVFTDPRINYIKWCAIVH